MPSTLFSPITIAGGSFANRIVVAPVGECSAVDGCATN
jgi:2,4-dienoyl-CoA reductase-like NADH-dependent reductase (Old Yellow Enzyme family)